MKTSRVRFSGAILARGFWLYAWRITCGNAQFFYVGRTGDSSSQYAASPFSRLGQHLDVRPKAAANMLLRHVRNEGLDPTSCDYELVAFGPIFPEQLDLTSHRVHRNRIAPLETQLAELLRGRGFRVVGKHGSKHMVDEDLLCQVRKAFNAEFRDSAG
jgi:hypothetical protein